MKKSTQIFLRTLYLSTVIIFCILIGFFGMAQAYKNIRLIGFGEYREAIEIEQDKIKFFDIEIKKEAFASFFIVYFAFDSQ